MCSTEEIMFPFFHRFKNRYSVSISVTISLGEYNMLKVSQYAPTFEMAKNLLITNLKTFRHGDYGIKIDSFINNLFGRDFDGS
jgi:hypothetical protein